MSGTRALTIRCLKERDGIKIVLLDTAGLGEDIDLSPLQAFPDFTFYEKTEPAQLEERIKDAEILITTSMKLNRQNLGAATPSFIINLSRQGILFIPMLFVLEKMLGQNGLIWAQPVVDVLSMLLAVVLYIPVYRKMIRSSN